MTNSSIPTPRFELVVIETEDQFAEVFPVLKQLSIIETPESADKLTPKKSWEQYLVAYDQGYRLYAARSSTEVLGAVGIRVCYDPLNDGKPYALINNLVVEEDYRGIGIGSIILTRAESLAKKDKATHAVLAILTSNKQAKKLYEELGYSIVSHLMIKEI